ncbi:MAG: glycosyltransferase [Bacteroidia bacterium]
MHALNFHNDWTPAIVKLDKPFIWGPIGHHPAISAFIKPFYGAKAWLSDRLKAGIKASFRNLIPGLRRTAREADHIFAMHPGVAPKLGLRASQYSLLPSVGTEWVEPPVQQSRDGFSLISVGRFVPLKGFDISIQAFAHFYQSLEASHQQNLSLKLVGKGPEKERLERLVQRLGLEEAIEFIEWMPREELLKQYGKAAAFLFPSHEGAGMVVAEALSFGLPVICIDNVGPGAFVTDECGLKAPYDLGYEAVCQQLGEHILKLYQEPKSQQAMAAAARRRFETHFDWREKGRQMRSQYHRLLQTQIESA